MNPSHDAVGSTVTVAALAQVIANSAENELVARVLRIDFIHTARFVVFCITFHPRLSRIKRNNQSLNPPQLKQLNPFPDGPLAGPTFVNHSNHATLTT